MAAEVKYDSLPFIDVSGKDCFEAGGELSTMETHENYELMSDSVDHIMLNQAQSFSAFKDKYLDSSKIDFSDSILASRKTGYEAKSIYEIIGDRASIESPQQKYQRLQIELKELAEEVEAIKSTESAEKQEVSPAVLSEEVKLLQEQLHNLHLEKILGTDVMSSGGTQTGAWSRQICDQLKSIQSKTPQGQSSNEKDVVYEIYYRPEHAKYAQAAKISELEAKLKSIEEYVGKGDQKFQSIISEPESTFSSLLETVESIHAKLSLFDVNHIDVITARLQGLLHCVNELAQKKDSIEETDNQSKIDELYKLVSECEGVATIVPDVVERLKTLKLLHEQASTFAQSLEHLTRTQTDVSEQLRSQKDTLSKFEESFASNISSMTTNCESLNKRIEDLVKNVHS